MMMITSRGLGFTGRLDRVIFHDPVPRPQAGVVPGQHHTPRTETVGGASGLTATMQGRFPGKRQTAELPRLNRCHAPQGLLHT